MPKDGYLIDYISGIEVKSGPEEIDAVQPFSKILVEDYNYPKTHIQTRPQFKVKKRPSDKNPKWPVDIAVFPNEDKKPDDVEIIVECKMKTRKDGRDQLEDYMRLSRAVLGVWYNGEERLYIRKIEKDGVVTFDEIPNIPKFGQRFEDIGRFKRKDLTPTHNLKSTFKTIRNYLAANNVGATRDEILAQQLINIIFCKIYDEKWTAPDKYCNFRAGIDEKPQDVKNRIMDLFKSVKRKYKTVLDEGDRIDKLDDKSIVYVVGELQNFSIIDSERDVISDAFETFIGHALKGAQGQFFTPRNVVKMMVEILAPTTEEVIIDPACGSGGFLVESLRYVWRQLDVDAKAFGWNAENLQEEKSNVAISNIRGIDKDYFLAKVAKSYMAVIGDGKSGIFTEDSLNPPKMWESKTRQKIKLDSFDVVLTNPPFGSKIPVSGKGKLEQYQIGHKWKYDKKKKSWEIGKLKEKEAPQFLFIERCLQLLNDGGRMGIVLPDGVFGNHGLGYIRKLLLAKARLIAVIDVPIETFMPNTSTKTSILILVKESGGTDDDYPIFMTSAQTCGHDRRGNKLDDDDISLISAEFHKWKLNNKIPFW